VSSIGPEGALRSGDSANLDGKAHGDGIVVR